MKGRFIFALVLAAVAMVASWTVSFASAPGGTADGVVAVAPAADRPVLVAWRGVIAPVTPGDLFIIDTRDRESDLRITLNLVNTGELVPVFRYLVLEVVVRRLDETGARPPAISGDLVTMLDPAASFVLPAGARFVIAVDGGSFATFPVGNGDTAVLPEFFVTTD